MGWFPRRTRSASPSGPLERRSIEARIIVVAAALLIGAIGVMTIGVSVQALTAADYARRVESNDAVSADFTTFVSGVLNERALALRVVGFPASDPGFVIAGILEERNLTLRNLRENTDGIDGLYRALDTASLAVQQWHDGWASEVFVRRGAKPEILETQGLGPREEADLFARVLAGMKALGTGLETQSAALRAEAQASRTQLMVANVLMGLSLCLVLGLWARWLLRSIIRPLRSLAATAHAQLQGESVQFRPEYDDEIGEVARLLEAFRTDVEARYGEARAAAHRGTVLNQLGDRIGFASSEAEMIAVTVTTLRNLIPTRRGDLQLVNASRNRLLYAGGWGEAQSELQTPVQIDSIDRCPAMRRAAVYSVDDVTDELAFACPAHPTTSGSLACVPLLAMGQPIGVIHLGGDQPFPAEVLALASRIGEQVAVAIANARLMRTMETLAMTDGLTGLRNARFFDDHLQQALTEADRDGKAVAVIMIDLDHFKAFNDAHGHPAGDEALRVLGRVVRGSLRASDMAARYGGEEFIVALHDTGLDGAALVAEKLRQAIAHAVVEIGPGRFARISASLGVAGSNEHGREMKGLVAAADAALYGAKTEGRDRVHVAGRVAVVPLEAAGAPTLLVAGAPQPLPAGTPAPRPMASCRGRYRPAVLPALEPS